tara:strand:+ start:411 stop:854 length:444 start_codon:yes stop_codon:yes gene_type:complete
MSKTISYRGKLPIGEQDRIRLKTINGKVGYRITKFQVITTTPGAATTEMIGQIYKTDQTGNITTTVDFSDKDLLAMAYYQDGLTIDTTQNMTVIFDNEKINQDIFVNITDAAGTTVPANYYIELEAMALSDIESTMLTLQSLRTVSE